MKLILLSGQSISNKEWIESVSNKLQSKYPNTHIQQYSHWNTKEKYADIEKETKELINNIKNTKEEYCIFAKSIGTIIALNTLKEIKHKPKFCIFLGIPLNLSKELGYDIKKLSFNTSFPIKIFQKENDSFGKYEDLKYLERENVKIFKYENTKEENNNHNYSNLEYILEIFKC